MGLELTRHPLVWQPGYREIAHLPLAERVAALRQPERRARILSEAPVDEYNYKRTMRWDRIFEIAPYPEYEPEPEASIGAEARRRGLRPEELVRSEEHTSELQSLMRISYAVFCLKKKKTTPNRIRNADTASYQEPGDTRMRH